MFPNQIQGLVLAQKRPAVPAEAKHGVGNIMTACWAHKPSKRPAMADVINDLLHAAFQYLWDTNGRGTLTAGASHSLSWVTSRISGEQTQHHLHVWPLHPASLQVGLVTSRSACAAWLPHALA